MIAGRESGGSLSHGRLAHRFHTGGEDLTVAPAEEVDIDEIDEMAGRVAATEGLARVLKVFSQLRVGLFCELSNSSKRAKGGSGGKGPVEEEETVVGIVLAEFLRLVRDHLVRAIAVGVAIVNRKSVVEAMDQRGGGLAFEQRTGLDQENGFSFQVLQGEPDQGLGSFRASQQVRADHLLHLREKDRVVASGVLPPLEALEMTELKKDRFGPG